MRFALVLALGAALVSPALAQDDKPDRMAYAAIQGCIKSHNGTDANWESCIGIVSNPCLDRAERPSTADMIACIDREQKVWDDILNETYRRLRAKIDTQQQMKLRDTQRAWIASREKTCAFYWDYFQGTMASPMSASCDNREIARRALFLLGFLNDAEGK